MSTPTPLGLRLKALRDRTGLSSADLGELVGLLSPANIAMIERGERGERLSATVAIRLARTLGCTVEWLIEGVGHEPDEFAIKAAVARAEAFKTALRGDSGDLADEVVVGRSSEPADARPSVAP